MTLSIADANAVSFHGMKRPRSYQHLDFHDSPRIAAFFLCFDFDQRRSYFGGGVSDQSVQQYCQDIDWAITDMIGRTGPYCLEALAMITELPIDCTKAELAIACPLACRQSDILSDLIVGSIEFGLSKYRSLIVQRELAHPDLVAQLIESKFAITRRDEIEIILPSIAETRRVPPAKHYTVAQYIENAKVSPA
jgi:hypothetical protein